MADVHFMAECTAVVSKNGSAMVLLKFNPSNGHLIGEIAKKLGELERGQTYEVTIRKVGPTLKDPI